MTGSTVRVGSVVFVYWFGGIRIELNWLSSLFGEF